MTLNLFSSILLLLTLSIFVTAFCQRIKIPVLVGYIVVGILAGSSGIGFLTSSDAIKLLAEFGIVFLMFTVGLEFSLPRLMQLKKDVFCFGSTQVIFSILLTMALGLVFKLTLIQSFIVGAIVAMSSTAIVLRQLTEQGEINNPSGQHALGILLFQDLAVIPILILLPSLESTQTQPLSSLFGLALIKGAIAITLLIFVGTKVLKPLFYKITSNHSLELFTLMILFITFLCAGITSSLGLSYTLGAFLAGMVLGETEFKHQIKTDIRPFKDILIGFFFITVGTQFNTTTMITAWNWTLLMFVALVFFKVLLISVLGLFFTRSKYTALQTGLILAQGSEFGFVILNIALESSLFPDEYGQVILAALLFSMLLAPLVIKHQHAILKVLKIRDKKLAADDEDSLKTANQTLKDHILLCGYGRVGQNIARFLDKANLQYIALDLDPLRVRNARLAGDNVFYADATDYQNLQHAHIEHARAIIIGFINPQITANIIELIRKHHEKIPIIVRCHDDAETNLFYEKGATEVIPEIFETSLMISSHILLMMNVLPEKVNEWVNQSRQKRYVLLRMVFPGLESATFEEDIALKEGLHVVKLPDEAFAVNHFIIDLNLIDIKIKIMAIRRGLERIVEPPPNFKLHAGDVIVLYGQLSHLEHAEKILLIGEDHK